MINYAWVIHWVMITCNILQHKIHIISDISWPNKPWFHLKLMMSDEFYVIYIRMNKKSSEINMRLFMACLTSNRFRMGLIAVFCCEAARARVPHTNEEWDPPPVCFYGRLMRGESRTGIQVWWLKHQVWPMAYLTSSRLRGWHPRRKFVSRISMKSGTHLQSDSKAGIRDW